MAKENAKIGTLDLNESAFQSLNGNEPELVLEAGRVTFYFAPSATYRRLSENYRGNVTVPVLDFVQAQRRLKSQVMTLRNCGGGERNGGRR